VSTIIEGESKATLINKIDDAIKAYNSEISALQRKYEGDLAEWGRHIESLQKLNEKYIKEIRDKDRLINQLKNNNELLDEQIGELTQQVEKSKLDIDFFRSKEFENVKYIRNTMGDINDVQYKIKQWKDSIFGFLINERNKGANGVRLDFYKSIVSLLMMAAEGEKDKGMDLKKLMNYFTDEGRKIWGKNYVFHDKSFDVEPDAYLDRDRKKHNKSEVRLAGQTDFNRLISDETTKFLMSNDATSLTEIGSNVSKKRKKGNKKAKILEQKVKELNDEIDKQKNEVKKLQDRLQETSYFSPAGSRTPRKAAGLERFSLIRTEKPTSKLSNSLTPSPNENLLQYLWWCTKVLENNLMNRHR
jgi:predicted  nucleic acid-binding Zn-ribbon protein